MRTGLRLAIRNQTIEYAMVSVANEVFPHMPFYIVQFQIDSFMWNFVRNKENLDGGSYAPLHSRFKPIWINHRIMHIPLACIALFELTNNDSIPDSFMNRINKIREIEKEIALISFSRFALEMSISAKAYDIGIELIDSIHFCLVFEFREAFGWCSMVLSVLPDTNCVQSRYFKIESCISVDIQKYTRPAYIAQSMWMWALAVEYTMMWM